MICVVVKKYKFMKIYCCQLTYFLSTNELGNVVLRIGMKGV